MTTTEGPFGSATFDFGGAVVCITGGTRGIGRGIAEAFLQDGATVIVCGRSEPQDAPSAAGKTATFMAADVRDADACSSLVADIVSAFGRLDVVVNNAGGSPEVLATDASPRFHESIVRLNLLAPLHLSVAANAQMQSQASGGSIVNIASVSAVRPSPGTAAYGAAKAGLVSLTQSLAIEWAPKVRVNAIIAGLIATEHAADHYGGENGLADVAATVPLGRMGDPGDIADACRFLASPLASYASGSSITLHGGGERPAFLAAARSADPPLA